MNRARFALPALLLFLALASPALAVLQVGQTAPDFTIPDTAGVNHSLSEYRGKVVLILFWQST